MGALITPGEATHINENLMMKIVDFHIIKNPKNSGKIQISRNGEPPKDCTLYDNIVYNLHLSGWRALLSADESGCRYLEWKE